MRIVAGEYSSRRIEAPKGNTTRPTLDKVREAVFSSLGGMFDGGSFLDLYAGSGANGLEALSRGFDEAVFVDISREAISVIKENIRTLRCEDRTQVLPVKDMKALSMLSAKGRTFDLVYLDPPYAKQHNDEILAYLCEHEMLRPGARVVIESLKEDTFTASYGTLKPYKEAVYGISRITYYRIEEQ